MNTTEGNLQFSQFHNRKFILLSLIIISILFVLPLQRSQQTEVFHAWKNAIHPGPAEGGGGPAG